MKKTNLLPFIYVISLLLFSLGCSIAGIKNFSVAVGTLQIPLRPVLIFTIAGGLIFLRMSISKNAFRTFLIFYCTMWLLRNTLLFFGNQIGIRTIFNRSYHFDVLIRNFFSNVYLLEGPLPFILFWLIIRTFYNKTTEAS